MPTEERFRVNAPETDTVYPESPKSPSVPESPNAPGRPAFQDHVDRLEDQNVQPGETGEMPSTDLEPGRQDEGPSVSAGENPARTANSGF